LWQDGTSGPVKQATEPGLYWVEVEDSNGCTGRDSSFVSGLPAPVVSLGNDSEVCLGDSLMLDAGNEGIFAQYSWQDQSLLQHFLVKAQGIYWVNVINPCGSSSDTVEITFKDCETVLWVPNAFTPGNSQNNEFQAEGQNLASFELIIYSRWGEMVFKSNDIETGWDGTFSGKPCPSDVYVWVIFYKEISDPGAGTQVKKGNVLLIR
jgi:gliding motility-associated-like protein